MAVTFLVRPHASNKAIDVLLQLISYHADNAAVLRPAIDKISLVFDVEEDDRDGFNKNLWDLVKDKVLSHAAKPKGAARYKTRAQLHHPGTGSNILVEANPSAGSQIKRFGRLEFNPAQLGPEGVAFLKDALYSQIFLQQYDWGHIAHSGEVTRLDIAVDIRGLKVSDLLLQAQGKSHCYFSLEGALETAYLGIKKKASQIKAYDKGQQLAETQGTDEPAYTRCEITCYPKLPIVKLDHMKNPLHRLKAMAIPGLTPPAGVPSHQWMFFLDACRLRGIANALSLIPDEKVRTHYADALESEGKKLWRPEKLWTHFSDTLTTSGLKP